jgi:hypothetical protein
METEPMSEAVDKFITDLEENWGAKPKPGNVSPSKEESFAAAHGGKPKAKATPDGHGGMIYTATPKKAGPVVVDGNGPMIPTPEYSLKNLNKILDEDEKVVKMQISKSAKVKVPKGCFDTSKMLTAPTVTMMEATKLYQPVRGTSSGSRYFMFAISPALRVAVRWKSTPSSEGLALRVEGSGLTNPYTVKMLEQIGLDKKSDTHMSAHLTAANDIEARKALGALLFALNEPWSTPTPDPGVVCV